MKLTKKIPLILIWLFLFTMFSFMISQPIKKVLSTNKKFSHQTHSGILKLECQKCHSTEGTLTSMIPTCLTCHKFDFTKYENLKRQQQIDTFNYFVFETIHRNTDSVKYNQTFGDTIKGDFNGDGVFEYLWVDHSIELSRANNKKKKLMITARSSSKKISPLVTSRDYDSGILYNEGDLNNDGTHEVSFVIWAEGSWVVCYVYSLKNNKWYEPIDSFSMWDGLGDDNVKVDPSTSGNVIVNEWFHKDSIFVKSKSVPIKGFVPKK